MQAAVETAASPLARKTKRPALPRATIAIVATAIMARGLVVWFAVVRFPHDWLYSRGIELGTLAQSLVVGQGLSSPFGGSTGPTALLAPGYPALIALFFWIFGSFTFAAPIAVMTMQLVFSVATVLAIMRVARQCFGVGAANIAGAFWAVSLPLIWMPTIFWETCLSTLILVGMIALALRREGSSSRWRWAIMGAYCGLAALVNPALLPALLAIFGWTAWRERGTSRWFPVAGLLVFTLVFAPWPIRNARELHAFIPSRSTVGFELWVGNRPGATGFLDESQFPIFNKTEYDRYAAMGEVAYMGEKSELARAYIRSHPVEFLRLSAMRALRFWTGTGSKDGSPIFAVHGILTMSLGMLGFVQLFRRRRFGLAMLFLLPLLLFPLPYYITHAEFRYRLVVDPLLTILAAYAVCEWAAPTEEERAQPRSFETGSA